MHVGLNLVFLVPGETGGMEVAARALLPELVRAAAPGTRFTAFVSRAAADLRVEGMTTTVLPVDARSRVDWVRGEQFDLPRAAMRAGCDLVHSLASTGPVRGRFRRVVTVHDLIYRVVPEAHEGLRSLGMRVLVPAAGRCSHRVIAISQATRDDVVAHLGVPADRVDVVAQGVTEPPPRPRPDAVTAARARLGLGNRRLLLTFSAKRRHKNLERLLEAHAALGNDRPLLVLPGYPTAHEAELRERAEALGIADDVRLLGWVSDADAEALYALAAAFVFPSLYEGFGLPVLEAMVRGVPVACSDRSSLPEVAGDAALLFDPGDTGAIAAALRRVLGDEPLRERLRAAGPPRAATFTWERTARGTLATYARAA